MCTYSVLLTGCLFATVIAMTPQRQVCLTGNEIIKKPSVLICDRCGDDTHYDDAVIKGYTSSDAYIDDSTSDDNWSDIDDNAPGYNWNHEQAVYFCQENHFVRFFKSKYQDYIYIVPISTDEYISDDLHQNEYGNPFNATYDGLDIDNEWFLITNITEHGVMSIFAGIAIGFAFIVAAFFDTKIMKQMATTFETPPEIQNIDKNPLNMANIPPNKIIEVAMGYNRKHFHAIYGYICSDIIQCQMLFLQIEGIPHDVEMETGNNAPIASEDTIPRKPSRQFNELIGSLPPQYWDTVNSMAARSEFCIQMKNEYNITKGMAIKLYNYVCNVRSNQEGIDQKASFGLYQYIPCNKKT